MKGTISKLIELSVSPIAFSKRSNPDPLIPAAPVPEPKYPIVSPGNSFRKPRIVLSPIALKLPYNTAATKAR